MIVDPFRIDVDALPPEAMPLGRVHLPPFPADLTLEQAKTQAAKVVARYEAQKSRWEARKRDNRAVFDAVRFYAAKGLPLPTVVRKALAHALGTFKYARRRESASRAAQAEGRALAKKASKSELRVVIERAAARYCRETGASRKAFDMVRRCKGYEVRRAAARAWFRRHPERRATWDNVWTLRKELSDTLASRNRDFKPADIAGRVVAAMALPKGLAAKQAVTRARLAAYELIAARSRYGIPPRHFARGPSPELVALAVALEPNRDSFLRPLQDDTARLV